MGRKVHRMSEIRQEQRDALYQDAVEVIRREWLAEGTTPEEWDRSERVAELFSQAVASGESVDDLLHRWQGLTAEQILAESETRRALDGERLLGRVSLAATED
jgi:hypothetical protein